MIFIALLLATQVGNEAQPQTSTIGKVWVRADFPATTPRTDAASGASHATPDNSGEYYPVEALRHEEQGRVVATVSVGVDGRATTCSIAQSSGSHALDEQTCRIALTRAHWKPATDSDGRPVASSTTFPLVWKLPAE